MTFVFLTVSLRWMSFLTENAIFWKHCCLCGNHYKVVKDLDRQSIYRYSSTRGCLVCTYRDRKEIYYRTLVKTFEIDDEKRFLESLKTTMWYMYRELGPIASEDVFYRAAAKYWQSTQEQNHRF